MKNFVAEGLNFGYEWLECLDKQKKSAKMAANILSILSFDCSEGKLKR
jgi:hypothetical protein